MNTFFGFAIADSMFPAECRIEKRALTPAMAKMAIENGAIPCLNPSHMATITAMRERFGIDVVIPGKPPVVALQPGDSVIVMAVRGLPRLTDRHEYTPDEIAGASFAFSCYEVSA